MKLKSGEDIIAKMVNNKKDSIEIERPMILKTMHLVDNMSGQKRETMVLYDWLKATDRIRITLPKDHILLITNCNPDVLKAYEIQKKYDDAPFTLHRPREMILTISPRWVASILKIFWKRQRANEGSKNAARRFG